jgi:hypothetical protein
MIMGWWVVLRVAIGKMLVGRIEFAFDEAAKTVV